MSYKTTSYALFLAAILLSSATAFASENVGTGKTSSFKTQAAGCSAATHQTELNINNVRTTLLSGGDLWWNLNDARYEIPKIEPGPNAPPSVHALFAGAIWLGGIDAGGNLKLAAQTYRQTGNDFWPGPLDATAQVSEQTCNDYDWHWKVLASDIDRLRAAAERGVIGEADVDPSLLAWPAKNNTAATGNNGTSISIGAQDLAPFFDKDQDGEYDPFKGDYPALSNDQTNPVYADEMIFWVYNDKGNIHTETNGVEIGIQVNALAFAFATSDEINDMTFYKYKLINKATQPIAQFYMGQWVDPDLGCYTNDYVGCDTLRSLGICYNATSTDPDCATRGYGVDPPLVGVDYFEGPLDENGNQLGMSAFVYYNNDNTIRGNPGTATHFYNYMRGFWQDNTCFTSDVCNGYGGSQCTRYMFPSAPNISRPPGWSECACGNVPADRRFLQASGPFTLQPGASNNITVGVVWVRPKGFNCNPFESAIGFASDKAQALFDNGFKLVDGPDAPTLTIRELNREIIISITNNPPSNNINESYKEVDPVAKSLGFRDSFYVFQGYQVYQLVNGQVSAQELGDDSKAKLIATGIVDIKDGITRIINYDFDPILGDIPKLEAEEATDQGIRKSFRVTEDVFATGVKTLVNHKTYYFTAIAYAYNNYKPYNSTEIPPGQPKPYLPGRRNFKTYSAIPHKYEPGRGGTVLNAQYGDGVEITRLDGQGNGGLNLELTDESVYSILSSSNHFYDHIIYKKGMGPLNVKVFDPMKLQEADFTLTMIDTCTSIFANCAGPFDLVSINREAGWKLDIMSGAGSTTIWAEKGIATANEQLLADYGISISLAQVDDVGRDSAHIKGFLIANGLIEATIEYANPEVRWLAGLHDDGTFESDNWQRSGQYAGSPDAGVGKFFNDHSYFTKPPIGSTRPAEPIFWDPNSVFASMLEGTWSPYSLAANWANRSATFSTARAMEAGSTDPYSYGPAFYYKFTEKVDNVSNWFEIPEHTLDSLHSVDVVLTSDKSKWTRCVVVETGENDTLSEGRSWKGQIRYARSWDKTGSGSYLSADTGRSWFPGYAINVETGERLNVVFGEDSWLVGENGRDMIWNPTSNESSVQNRELFGGKHHIYIMNTKYDEGAALQRVMLEYRNVFTGTVPVGNRRLRADTINNNFYKKIMWVSMAFLEDGYKLKSVSDGLIPTDVKVRIRVNVPYSKFSADNSNGGVPKYFFSTRGLGTNTDVVEAAKNACDLVKAVPNPYYAYSSYETNQLDNRVKITNLPDNCTVSIYTLNGTLIRRFDRAITRSRETSRGFVDGQPNLDNSIDWDLKNNKNITVASGIYLIHIKADGVCEKVVKWFGSMRPIDLDTF